MIDTSMPVWPIPFNLDGFVSRISASERVTLALRLCVGAILLIFLGGTPAGGQENYQETLRKAEQGDGDAQASLGFMFAEGRDGEQDRAEAVRWFRLAAEQGNANGQAGLGVSYFDGEGVAQDTAEAVRWFRLAAEQGNAIGQAGLGSLYFAGEGVPHDPVEAVRWFRLAAEQDELGTQPENEASAMAQFALALSLLSGTGVKQDSSEALHWFRLVARQEDQGASQENEWVTQAQSMLGLLYSQGIMGVEKDDAEAFGWNLLAAERGNAEAQAILAEMYAAGRGVPKDIVLAHMWFNVADTSGSQTAGDQRVLLERGMNGAQITRANALARECVASNYRDCGSIPRSIQQADGKVADAQPALKHLSIWTSPTPAPNNLFNAAAMLAVRVVRYCEPVSLQPGFHVAGARYHAVVPGDVDLNILAAATPPHALIKVSLTSASGHDVSVATSEGLKFRIDEVGIAIPRSWSIARETGLRIGTVPGLAVGENTLEILVSSEDGNASRSYVIELNRLQPSPTAMGEPECADPALDALLNAVAELE